MYPGTFAWWKHARRRGMCGVGAAHGACGDGHAGTDGWEYRFAGGDHDFRGGAFGVRRPLRFLAYKLELKDDQVTRLAAILDELKTERAQAAVDERRTSSAFADAISSDSFDETKVADAAADRVKSAERLRAAITKALGQIHALLDANQRAKLAYLIRTGALAI